MGEQRQTQFQGMWGPQTVFLHMFSNQMEMEDGNYGNLETERCWQMQKSLNVCRRCTVQVFTAALEQLLVDSGSGNQKHVSPLKVPQTYTDTKFLSYFATANVIKDIYKWF